MRIFTKLYRHEVSLDDAYVIIETDTNIEVSELTTENVTEAITTTSDRDMAEKLRDYYAEKFRTFYAMVDPSLQKET